MANLTVPTQVKQPAYKKQAAKPNTRMRQLEEEDEIQIEQPLNRR